MDKLKMRSPNLTDENIAKIAELFPNSITKVKPQMNTDKEYREKGRLNYEQKY
ncbi:MAG: hypothetical protein U9O87_00685 [Verrucomicrobiota bacterium]|nr:hypothetical protein [Verrucomicrobiota bacterium]